MQRCEDFGTNSEWTASIGRATAVASIGLKQKQKKLRNRMIHFWKNLHFLFLMQRGNNWGWRRDGPLELLLGDFGRLCSWTQETLHRNLMYKISPVTPKIKVIRPFSWISFFRLSRDSQACASKPKRRQYCLYTSIFILSAAASVEHGLEKRGYLVWFSPSFSVDCHLQ